MPARDFESNPSVKALMEDLVREIPYAPYTPKACEVMRSLDLSMLLHIFHMWRQRFIMPQPRTFVVPKSVSNDPLYVKNKDAIAVIREKVERGDDLTPYLSMQIDTSAFNPEKFAEDGSFKGTRDEMLITDGFHHMHLVEKPARSNEILIVWDTGSSLEVLGVVTHSIFDDVSLVRTDTRYRRIVDDFLSRQYPDGGFMIGGPGGGMQNTAASSAFSSMFQIKVYRYIREVECFDGGIEGFTRDLFSRLLQRNPQFVKPKWLLDKDKGLGIYDRRNKVHFWCSPNFGWSAEVVGQTSPTPA